MENYQKILNQRKAKATRLRMEIEQGNIPDALDIIKARQSLLDFTLYTKHDYEVNWHHQLTCKYLDLFLNRKIKNLMIWQPPQHGKTELALRRLVPYILGHNPNEKIVSFTHTDRKAKKEGRQISRIMKRDSYKELFPLTTLNERHVVHSVFENAILTANNFEIIGHQGSYLSTSFSAGSAGETAETLLIDDPYKNEKEANSEVIREGIWDAYESDLETRKSIVNAHLFRQLIIQTRWHEEDLSGKLLKREPNNWTVLRLPAICDEDKHKDDPREIGQALWEVKVSIQELEEKKKNRGSLMFSALYQQNPSVPGGHLFKRKHFKYYDLNGAINLYNTSHEVEKHLNLDGIKFKFSVMDLAISLKETADYTVLMNCMVTNENDLLIDEVIRGRISGADHLDLLKQNNARFNPDIIGIEKVQYQLSLIQQAEREGLPVKALTPKGDKVARAIPASAKFESGKVYLKINQDWLYEFETELTQFPNGKHDDQVDCISYAVEYLIEILNIGQIHMVTF